MKPYSVDSNARETVVLVLLIISFFLARYINGFLVVYSVNLSNELKAVLTEFDFWGISVTAVTVIGVFGILYSLFCRWLWKIPIFISLHGVTNLSGTWKGALISSHLTDGKRTIVKFIMEVKQDWNHMRIKCTFPNSSSHNTAAFIFSNGDGDVEFGFPYCNDSQCIEWKVKKHDGYSTLTVNGNSMKGRYFTNREDGTNGIMVLKKIVSPKQKR